MTIPPFIAYFEPSLKIPGAMFLNFINSSIIMQDYFKPRLYPKYIDTKDARPPTIKLVDSEVLLWNKNGIIIMIINKINSMKK